MNEDDLFLQQMQGVKPLQQDKVALKKTADEKDFELLRQAASSEETVNDPLASAILTPLKPEDIVGYKKPGVQEGVYRKLRLGKYEIDARLDLHRLTVEQARLEVYRFINDCIDYDLRTVMILHGKGDRAKDPAKKALLKSHCMHWLEQIDAVLAYHSAQRHHGGAGAVYVLLKKSDLAKQRNREKHGQR
jgi:DNA-nicking Smr family endonuclease